jgi:hypothetical protein
MALDLNNGYDKAKDQLKAYKTFGEVKKSINDTIKKGESSTQPDKKQSTFQVDQAELQSKIKKQVQGQFDQLIGLLSSSRGSGSATFTYLTRKFVTTVKKLRAKIPELIRTEILKALTCEIDATYEPGTYYIKVSSIDLFRLLETDPTTNVGKMLYEPTLFLPSSDKRSNNRLFYDLIQNENVSYSSTYSQDYLGKSTNPLFDITFVETNPITGNQDGWFRIDLKEMRPGVPNKVAQFLVDYYETIAIIQFKSLIAALIEAVLGVVSVKLRFGTTTLDDSTKFGLLVQRILGLCFDEAQEITVAGQAKTPELDDTTDSFFEMTNLDTSIIQQRTSEIQRGVVSFESCDNIEFPLDVETVIDIVNESVIQEDGSGFERTLENITLSFMNDPKWSIKFPFPDQLKISFDFNFVKKIPVAVVSTVISPKTLFPFVTMMVAMGKEYDMSLKGLSSFTRQNKQLMKNLVSKIGAEFIETIFNELKRDIRTLVKSIILDIKSDEAAIAYAMIERLVSLALAIASIVRDFRQCKSVIDSILQLFNLVSLKSGQSIPLWLVKLSAFLPGYSPNRAFINSISYMQQLGLPTGPLPDGSPNLGLQAAFAQTKGQDMEQKVNGKIEGVLDLPPPYGLVQVTGKNI